MKEIPRETLQKFVGDPTNRKVVETIEDGDGIKPTHVEDRSRSHSPLHDSRVSMRGHHVPDDGRPSFPLYRSE